MCRPCCDKPATWRFAFRSCPPPAQGRSHAGSVIAGRDALLLQQAQKYVETALIPQLFTPTIASALDAA